MTNEQLQERNHKFYLSTRWRQTRLLILNEYPICQKCHVEPALHVHHIVPLHIKEGWTNRLNFDYLMSICIACHRQETIKEQLVLRDARITARMEDLNTFD